MAISAVHPGEPLAEGLKELDMSAAELAEYRREERGEVDSSTSDAASR